MKLILLIVSILSLSIATAETKLAHNTCKVVLDAKFAEDGTNVVLLELSKRKLQKLKYEVVADETEEALALKIEVETKMNSILASCTISTTMRGSVQEEHSAMVLVNSVKNTGLVSHLGTSCAKALKKAISDLPKCNQLVATPVVDPVIDPVVDPVVTP
jgi:hypothetical protein